MVISRRAFGDQRAAIQQNAATLDLKRIGPRSTHVRSPRGATLEIDHPVVQRTCHGIAVHDALAERSRFVRASIIDGECLIGRGAEYRDASRGSAHYPRTAQRN